MRSKKPAALLLVLLLATVTAACGSRLSDEERALAVRTSSGSATGSGLAADETTDTTLAEGAVVAGDPAAAAGGGDPAAAAAAGGAAATGADGCKPGSATSTGVTPTEVKVGNVSQITGLVPGFAQTSVNGVRAYFNMINSSGGVCGRKLTLVTADDRFQSATNRSETEKMAGQAIALVGSLSVVDDGGAPIIDEKGIADISITTTAPRTQAKNNFSPNPIDPTPNAGNGLVGILEHFKRTDGISKPAIFYQDVATGANQAQSYRRDFERAGIPVPDSHIYPVAPTATNFNTQANDMKQKGIDFIITVAEVNAMSNLAKAFESVDYFPKVPFYGAQVYGQKFLKLAGAAAEGTRVGLIFGIPEETGNAATQKLAEWYRKTAPGQDLDFFVLASWVAADMFVNALRAAGPDPTQAKIVAEMQKVTSYTGNGLVGGINPAQKKAPTCWNVVEVRGGKWVKTFPAQGFQC